MESRWICTYVVFCIFSLSFPHKATVKSFRTARLFIGKEAESRRKSASTILPFPKHYLRHSRIEASKGSTGSSFLELFVSQRFASKPKDAFDNLQEQDPLPTLNINSQFSGFNTNIRKRVLRHVQQKFKRDVGDFVETPTFSDRSEQLTTNIDSNQNNSTNRQSSVTVHVSSAMSVLAYSESTFSIKPTKSEALSLHTLVPHFLITTTSSIADIENSQLKAATKPSDESIILYSQPCSSNCDTLGYSPDANEFSTDSYSVFKQRMPYKLKLEISPTPTISFQSSQSTLWADALVDSQTEIEAFKNHGTNYFISDIETLTPVVTGSGEELSNTVLHMYYSTDMESTPPLSQIVENIEVGGLSKHSLLQPSMTNIAQSTFVVTVGDLSSKYYYGTSVTEGLLEHANADYLLTLESDIYSSKQITEKHMSSINDVLLSHNTYSVSQDTSSFSRKNKFDMSKTQLSGIASHSVDDSSSWLPNGPFGINTEKYLTISSVNVVIVLNNTLLDTSVYSLDSDSGFSSMQVFSKFIAKPTSLDDLTSTSVLETKATTKPLSGDSSLSSRNILSSLNPVSSILLSRNHMSTGSFALTSEMSSFIFQSLYHSSEPTSATIRSTSNLLIELHVMTSPLSVSTKDLKVRPEPETSPKPRNTSRNIPIPEHEEPSHAEPVPDWPMAKQEWKAAWELHLYLFGILFAILSTYSLVSTFRLWQIKHLLSKQYFLMLNFLIFLFCILRTLYLLIDGYNANMTFNPILNYFLYSTGFPCLSSAFAILFYALLLATKMQVLSPKVQNLSFLMFIIVFHFILSILTDVIVGFFMGAKVLLFVCQLFFILWGFFLFVAYMYIFRNLYHAALKRQKTLHQLTRGYSHWNSDLKLPQERFTLSLGIKVTLLTSIIGLVCVSLQGYAVFGVYGIFSSNEPSPWPWWVFQSCLRLIEFILCLLMSYVATQPFNYHSKQECDIGFYFASCTKLCRTKNVLSTGDEPDWIDLDETLNETMVTKNGGRKEIMAAGYEIIPLTITLSRDNEFNDDADVNDSADTPPSMLVIENGFIRFRTDEEMGEHMQNAYKQPSKTVRKNSQGHQNGGFLYSDGRQNGTGLPDHVSPSMSPSSSQWIRISSAGSDITYRPPSLSLAGSIDQELEKCFRRSSITSRKSVQSLPDITLSRSVTLDLDQFTSESQRDDKEVSSILRFPRHSYERLTCEPGTCNKIVVFRTNSDNNPESMKNEVADKVQYHSLENFEKLSLNS